MGMSIGPQVHTDCGPYILIGETSMKRSMTRIAAVLAVAALCRANGTSRAQTLDKTKVGPVFYGAGGGPSLSDDGVVVFNTYAGDNLHAFDFWPDKPNSKTGTAHLLHVFVVGLYTQGSAVSKAGAVGWTEDSVYSTDHAAVLSGLHEGDLL